MTVHADGVTPAATGATRISRNPAAHTSDITPTNANGSSMPPIAYNQPPSDGPSSSATLVPDITKPMTRPRSSAPYRSAMSANPTTQVTPSAAPCTSRATNSHGSDRAKANSTLARASAIMPATSGRRRPTRSETAPIGTDTASNVRPKLPNRTPIVVGVAPSRWLRSGSTGTAIEYATTSVNVAHVTRATETERESRRDMGK